MLKRMRQGDRVIYTYTYIYIHTQEDDNAEEDVSGRLSYEQSRRLESGNFTQEYVPMFMYLCVCVCVCVLVHMCCVHTHAHVEL